MRPSFFASLSLFNFFDAITLSKWGKSGQLYWLCMDLVGAISMLLNFSGESPTKAMIDNQLDKCHHHASKLQIAEKNIVYRLQKLKDDAQQLSQFDWTSTRRKDVAQSLQSILNDVGTVSVDRQPDFDP